MKYALILDLTPSVGNGTLSLHSAVLGLDVRLEQGRLRIFDPTRDACLLTYQEAERMRQAAEQARQQAQAARQAAEAVWLGVIALFPVMIPVV